MISEAYDFDDILITPLAGSTAKSRSAVDLTVRIKGVDCVPIIAANMDNIGTFAVAEKLSKFKMMTALHKHHAVSELIKFFEESNEVNSRCFYSTGVSESDIRKMTEVLASGAKIKFFCIDVANLYTIPNIEAVERIVSIINSFYIDMDKPLIMLGNIAIIPDFYSRSETDHRILELAKDSIIKIGVGSGSACLTRQKTGVGVPQFSAVYDSARALSDIGGICSDGGCKNPGDVFKAFCAGAEFVMIGGMLAGHHEVTGEEYAGMSSDLMIDRYYEVTNKPYRTSEGRVTRLKDKGRIEDTIQDLLGGLRSGCTYLGCDRLSTIWTPQYQKAITFRKVRAQLNTIYEDQTI